MKTLRIHTHFDGAEALKLIELLDHLRDTLTEQYQHDIAASLAPPPEQQAELDLDEAEPPY